MASKGLRLGRVWEDEIHGLVDELMLGRKYKKPARAPVSSCPWTGAKQTSRAPVSYPGKGSKSDARGRLLGVARKSRQVIIKITGGPRTSKSLKSHFEYLSREGELQLHDQDGREVNGLEGLEDLAWGWKHSGPTMPESGTTKQAFNIVFSMPEGSDEKAVYAAIKATADVEFDGHQWVIVQHFDEPQVHAHVCVKAEGIDGQRLNPRKADLQRWRERFAYELRERGVEAEATRRIARLQRERVNKPWEVTRLEERGESTNPAPKEGNPERIGEWETLTQKASSLYERITDALRRTGEPQDADIARELVQRFPEQRVEPVRKDDDRNQHERN